MAQSSRYTPSWLIAAMDGVIDLGSLRYGFVLSCDDKEKIIERYIRELSVRQQMQHPSWD